MLRLLGWLCFQPWPLSAFLWIGVHSEGAAAEGALLADRGGSRRWGLLQQEDALLFSFQKPESRSAGNVAAFPGSAGSTYCGRRLSVLLVPSGEMVLS